MIIAEKLNGEVAVFEDVKEPQCIEKTSSTHDPVMCGCQSCGGRPVPADDLETRRKIERYRKRHG